MISVCTWSWLPVHSCLKDMLPDLVSNCTHPDSNLFFCFVLYAEPKGWDGNLWWCSVCPVLYMSITGVYLRKMSMGVGGVGGADNLLMCLSVLSS